MIDGTSDQHPIEPFGGLDARFCEMMDAAPVMIWVSGRDKRCLWFNRKWLIFTGRSMAQELGNGWAEGVHRDDFDRCLETYISHFDARKEFRMQYRLRQRDGAYHWIDDTGIPRYARGGSFLGYMGSCVDIHEYRATQDELRRCLQEIAHMNRRATAGELLASIAHQINQPLAAIAANGNAGLRWLGMEAPNLCEVKAALERIVRDVHHADNVVGTIRAMFKRGPQNKLLQNINKLILDVLALLQGDLQKHQVLVQTDLLPELPAIAVDRVQLQQVILNLVVNAIEAMESVTDRPRVLKITSGMHDPAGVLVTVEDSGTGVDPEKLDHIFEAFFTMKSHGMGMGLSVCRSIIEAHGGRMSARRRQPDGLALQIALPVHVGVSEP
jgi:PAS domain S-box-containing protein